ncbi:MAP kinase-activated protein kinase 2-like [Oppia nitens]|uniref:MAP kinase-activated protein kinase 2-like n=1 Tax=Oppia nitens TaxID=1686743 RepID=UPI0023DBD2C6|nr:MAP kinase-activated protein kinase 2-like [Oppia nitens]
MEHKVDPLYRIYLDNNRCGIVTDFPKGLAPFGYGVGYKHDDLYDDNNQLRTGKVQLQMLPIQGPPNWDQLWTDELDAGTDYTEPNAPNQPLPVQQIEYLKIYNEGDLWRDIVFDSEIQVGGYGSVWRVSAKRKVGRQGNKWKQIRLASKVMRFTIRSFDFKTNVNYMLTDMYSLKFLNHNHIVNFLDIIGIPDSITGFPYAFTLLFMDLCEGDVFDLMANQQENRLKPDECLTVLRQIGSAVQYMHNQQHMVHLDIKPENILWKYDRIGNIIFKLTDFGLAIQYSPDQQMESDVYAGTLEFQAPELGTGTVPTKPCDIYSLGCTIANLILGNNVYDPTMFRVYLANIEMGVSTLPNSPKVRTDLIRLVNWMSNMDPYNRPNIDEVMNYSVLMSTEL